MYAVDNLDKAVSLSGIPLPDIGAPMPKINADDLEVSVTYHVTGGSYLEDDLPVTVVFTGCYALLFGAPNDEALSGHPLADRGLASYGVFEVEYSSWVRALERMNRVHIHHNSKGFRGLRHFVITFHDNTFECVADGFSVLPRPSAA